MRKIDEASSSIVIGNRIGLIRSRNNMSQEDLANALSELSGSQKSSMLVSHWENGRRVPDNDTITLLANYFNVSEEYIRGYTDDPNSTETEKREANIRLKPEDYGAFDGKVVYLSFENYTLEDQPAIVNYDKHAFIIKNGKIAFDNSDIRAVYISEPDYMNYKSSTGMRPIDMATLRHTKHILWVEMCSPDSIVRTKYNGWYRKNERDDGIINIDEGYVLPYEGLNISYHAYIGKNTMRRS